jgi:3-oxoacyl-[acyl-carrier protein] reductase
VLYNQASENIVLQIKNNNFVVTGAAQGLGAAISAALARQGAKLAGMLVKVKDDEIVDRLSLQQWQQVIDINLTGVFLCGREAAASMIRGAAGGVIINISSISRAGNIGQSNYAAAKAGVAALTTTWARELARYKIRSAAIAPGVFETEMVASMKPEAHQRITSSVPLERTGAVTELAHAVRFIIENDYYSGRILELDGGLRL